MENFFTEQCLKMSGLIETEALCFSLFLLFSNNVPPPHPFSRALKGSTLFLQAICCHTYGCILSNLGSAQQVFECIRFR